MQTTYPIATSDVVNLLGIREHQIHTAVRSGRVAAPEVRAGRRAWSAGHVLALVEALGLKLTRAKRRALETAAEQEATGARR